MIPAAIYPIGTRPGRRTTTGIRRCCLTLLVLGAGLAAAIPASDGAGGEGRAPATVAGEEPSSPQANLRIREGTELTDAVGSFRLSGGRLLFDAADGKRQYVALENLNLERIARAVAESRQTLQWEVTGTVTEYRGANFLLVRRAVLRQGTPAAGAL